MHPLTAPSDRPLVIGHRGAMAMAPENTLASFKEAVAQGADGLECDVHLTQDGQVVVMHDFTLDRTSSGSGAIAAHALDELRGLDAGAWFDPRFAGEPIPTLEDTLRLAHEAPRPLVMVIELKAGSRRYPGIEAAVVRLVRAHALAERTVLISFDHHAIHAAKGLAPEIAGGVLYYAQPVSAPMLALAAGADALGPSAELVTPDEVQAAHAAGLRVFAWTATSPASGLRLARLGVDAMGANAPGEILAALAGAKGEQI